MMQSNCWAKWALGLGLALWVNEALAQSAVKTLPSPSGSVNVSGTIASGGVFQSIVVRNTGGTRQGCLVQNNGTNIMYVFFGPIADATTAKSFQLVPPSTGVQGGSVSCATGAGTTLQDQVSITGTVGEAFAAAWQ